MTFKYKNVFLEDTSLIAGPYEQQGPLKRYFDKCYDDLYFGEDSWEKAEIKLVRDSISMILKKNGIKCLLFDLDNTISPVSVKSPTKKVKDLFNDLKEMGFKVIIFSNSNKKRLEPFKEELKVEVHPNSRKPLKKSFLKIMDKYELKDSEVAIIGDQFLTDILGGNKVGITTILVNPIGKKDIFITKFNRLLEKCIMNKLGKKLLFVKGRYYD